MGRVRQHAPLAARAAPVSSRVARDHDQADAEGDRARSTEVIWPVWVQRCGIGSSCECPPHDQRAGVQRDLQRATAGGGAALPTATQVAMERAFFADFSAVRVHTGDASNRVAAGLGARALTAGQDILFRSGAFQPHTPSGDRLLAHELAHVVQQASRLPRAAIDGGPADPLEQAAEMAANQAVTSGRVAGPAPAPPTTPTTTPVPAAGQWASQPNTSVGRGGLRQEMARVIQRQLHPKTGSQANAAPSTADHATAPTAPPPTAAAPSELTHGIQQRNSGDTGAIQRQAVHDLTQITVLPELTEALSDEELQVESLRLRHRLSELTLGDPEYEAIRQNLHLVESQAARVHVELPEPPSGTEYRFEFQRRMLTPDPVSIRYVLERIIIESGQEGAKEFVEGAEGALSERDDWPPETKRMFRGYRLALVPVLQAQLGILKEENAQFVEEFEKTAKETLRDLLNQSENRINAERVRYGLPPGMGTFREEESGRRTLRPEYGIVPPPAVNELKEAAGLFLRLHAHRDERLDALRKEVVELKRLKYEELRKPESGSAEVILMTDQIEKDHRDIELEKRIFETQKAELARRFPVLASFFDEDIERLEQLFTSGPLDAMVMVWEEIDVKLGNISTVRGDLNNDDLNVWTLPRLVAITRARMHVAEQTMRDQILLDKVQHADDEGFWKSIGLGVIQLGLVLLAPVTGGYSLYGAAAISGWTYYRHAEEYAQQEALAGTDFDRALAISADEPSFFWLALDAVFFFTDASAALGVFRSLKALTPEIRAARTTEEAEQIVRATVPEGGEEFARRVAAGARIGEEVSATERIFGQEGRALEEAGKLAEREATETVLADIRTATGQQVKVTKHGHLVVCSSPCQWLRERFAKQIARNEELEWRIEPLERKAADAAKETDTVVAKRIADEVATETSALERDLAYAEYLEAGGTATLEGFAAAAERVRAVTAFTAHEVPALIPAARIDAVSSRLLRDFPLLGRLTKGAVERVVRAAHATAETGGLRRATRWLGAARGQLLEEIASTRVRGLLTTQAGREVLGIGHITDELVFIEGSRIRDAAGAMLTDGIIAIRHTDRLEIVAVMEAKAGSFAAGGLTESIGGLRRASTTEIIQAVTEASGGEYRSQRPIMRRLSSLLTPDEYGLLLTTGANLAENAPALRNLREALLSAIDRLPASDRRAVREALSHSEGQISRDLERLMKEGDGTVGLMIDDQAVTATMPARPSFVGAAPSNVPLTDVAGQLGTQGYDFRPLELGAETMTTKQLDKLATELVNTLGPDLIKAAKP